ncbi:MAG: DUF2281 domain-containing protein [Saprospiraceae bacterium]|nr:DUF2281 domain-containing protein [Saprospiraceae bacterium]
MIRCLWLKKKVSDFIDFLLFKSSQTKIKEPKTRAFGFFKDKVKMSSDFDEPISDFDKYME